MDYGIHHCYGLMVGIFGNIYERCIGCAWYKYYGHFTLKENIMLKRFHQDETGAVSVEQILLLALIFLPIIILLVIFKNKIVGWFQQSVIDLDQSRT